MPDVIRLPAPAGHLHSNGDYCPEVEVHSDQWPVEMFTAEQVKAAIRADREERKQALGTAEAFPHEGWSVPTSQRTEQDVQPGDAELLEFLASRPWASWPKLARALLARYGEQHAGPSVVAADSLAAVREDSVATAPTSVSTAEQPAERGAALTRRSIEGTIRFQRSSPVTQVCVCCPPGGGHIYGRGVDWDPWDTGHAKHFGRGADVLVMSHATGINANEGRRVRVTVEVLDDSIQPSAGGDAE